MNNYILTGVRRGRRVRIEITGWLNAMSIPRRGLTLWQVLNNNKRKRVGKVAK